MREYIEERAVEIANYIIENNATVRQTAKQFRISKSTVHKDVTERLLQINPSLAHETRKVLDTNKSERHIREGLLPEKNIYTCMLPIIEVNVTIKEDIQSETRTLRGDCSNAGGNR